MLFPITGDSSSWLSFWGSYIGAVLSSAIALYILYKQNQQNHTENIEKQLNVWETYDKQQKEKVINKISGFTPPKLLSIAA